VYIPEKFAEPRVPVMHELIRAYPLATVVTYSPGGLNANHLPLHLSDSPGPYGTLQGHIVRTNPLFKDIGEGIETLTIFHGPASYITPSWYATKKETGRVVPTWNYAVVHAYGVLRVVANASWLRAQLDALTGHNEAFFAEPWAVSDAPAEYIDKAMSAIVGVEMVITKLLGKWKVSQNQPAENRAGVVAGLQASGLAGSEAMAALVETAAKNSR